MTSVNILIYTVLLNGYGDIIYSKKLFDYIKDLYETPNVFILFQNDLDDTRYNQDKLNTKIKIAGFSNNDIIPENDIIRNEKLYPSLYGTFKYVGGIKFDLFLLAPVDMFLIYSLLPIYIFKDNLYPDKNANKTLYDRTYKAVAQEMYPLKDDIKIKDIIVDDLFQNFKDAAKNNTYLFSVYNAEDEGTDNNDFDFPLGIGDGKDGIFLNISSSCDFDSYLLPLEIRDIKFSLIHFNVTTKLDKNLCIDKYINYVSNKYISQGNFTFVLRSEVYQFINMENLISNLEDYPFRLYHNDDMIYTNSGDDSNILTFRTDILPLPFDSFKNLICQSVPEILTTGNQSVADVISCCPNKKIWFQKDPWSTSFSDALEDNDAATSCFIPNILKIKDDGIEDIRDNWNFENKGLPRLYEIIENKYDEKKNFYGLSGFRYHRGERKTRHSEYSDDDMPPGPPGF